MRQLDNRTTVEGLTRGVNLRYSGIRIPEDGESQEEVQQKKGETQGILKP